MAARYMPPHLRHNSSQGDGDNGKTATKAGRSVADRNTYTVHEIHKHFWPDGRFSDDESKRNVLDDDHGAFEAKESTTKPKLRNVAGRDDEVSETSTTDDPAAEPLDANKHTASTARERGTLNDSAEKPNELAYIVLYPGANPRWESDGIIFVKTSLDFLELVAAEKPPTVEGAQEKGNEEELGHDGGGEAKEQKGGRRLKVDGSSPFEHHRSSPDEEKTSADKRPFEPKFHRTSSTTETTIATSAGDAAEAAAAAARLAIPVFSPSDPFSSRRNMNFIFAGYFRIERGDFPAPQSPELVSMLRQKWPERTTADGRVKGKERGAADWADSLRRRWAVVKFVRDTEAEKARGRLQLRWREKREGGKIKWVNFDEMEGKEAEEGMKEGRTVNDILKDLRMRDKR